MAALVPNGRQQFIDINGKPLVAGTVGMYYVNTLIPKDTWQDINRSSLNTNPIILDSRGQATIWGVGNYRQIVKDSLGNTIWDKVTNGEGDGGGGTIVPVEAFGAIGDAYQITDTAINSGTNTLASSGSGFVSFTGSKAIVVNNAGTAVNGLATDLITTATFVSTSQLLLASNAGASVSGEISTLGTDNTSAIQAAFDDSSTAMIGIQDGLYLCASALVWPSGKLIYGDGSPTGDYRGSGIVGCGSLYVHQANIPTDPIAGTGGTIVITSATQSSYTATYVLSGGVPSWMTVGSIVTVTGMLASGYNYTNTVTAVGVGTFSMRLPASGLGASSQGGIATSQAGKRYVAYNGDTIKSSTTTYNLNITACNFNTAVAFGCLWASLGANTQEWQYNWQGCNFNGWVGRHLMWANGVNYISCVMQGTWSGDAFTMPTGLAFTGLVQKLNENSCVISQQQNVYGRAHYEYNTTGTAGVFTTWNYSGGAIEFGFGLGDFTGENYTQNTVHYERFAATGGVDLFVTIPTDASVLFMSPDAVVTSPQLAELSAKGGTQGTARSIWVQAGTIGAQLATLGQILGPGEANVPTTAINFSTPSAAFQRGLDINIGGTGTDNYAIVCSAGGAGTTNYGMFLSANNAATNYSAYFNAGHIFSNGTSVLPTSDPHVVGVWWNNAGIVTVSAG